MKLNVKKLSILGLVGIFLISAMLCCCLTNAVEAEEAAPSCHQTTQNTESSSSTEECECDQSLVTLKESVQIKDSLFLVASISLDQLLNRFSNTFSEIDAYQAPPLVYDTSPLYIKHSILRI